MELVFLVLVEDMRRLIELFLLRFRMLFFLVIVGWREGGGGDGVDVGFKMGAMGVGASGAGEVETGLAASVEEFEEREEAGIRGVDMLDEAV